jgi:threonine dehydrogenase-like Zn-dependent dehydrogenase
VPVHVPRSAVSVAPSRAVPETLGALVLTGGAGSIGALAALAALALAAALVAVTTTRTA